MVSIKYLLPALVLVALLIPAIDSPGQGDFQLIVHRDNPYESISAEQASDFFFKKDSSWDDGTPAQPVDLSKPEDVRRAFSNTVLQRSPNEIKKYWQRQIFTGRNSSPPEKNSEADIIAYVAANRGAIGYVSSGAKLSSGVRRIALR